MPILRPSLSPGVLPVCKDDAREALVEDGGADLRERDETPSRIVLADTTSGARELGTRKSKNRNGSGCQRGRKPKGSGMTDEVAKFEAWFARLAGQHPGLSPVE